MTLGFALKRYCNMIISTFIVAAFVCQIVVVSILCPRSLVSATRQTMPTQSDDAGSTRVLYRRYVLINYMIAALGLPGLLVCAALYFANSITLTGLLLSIGIVFLIQVSPLAILFYYKVSTFDQISNGQPAGLKSANKVPGLFAILPRVPILVAAGLYLAYVSAVGVQWLHSGGNQIPKIVAVTVTNLVCVAAILWTYGRLVRETDGRADRYMELVRMGPILVFSSILVTIYFFAKEVLFALDLHEARPIMMSAALQLIALVVFKMLVSVQSNRSMA
jgi:hypothetical protein